MRRQPRVSTLHQEELPLNRRFGDWNGPQPYRFCVENRGQDSCESPVLHKPQQCRELVDLHMPRRGQPTSSQLVIDLEARRTEPVEADDLKSRKVAPLDRFPAPQPRVRRARTQVETVLSNRLRLKGRPEGHLSGDPELGNTLLDEHRDRRRDAVPDRDKNFRITARRIRQHLWQFRIATVATVAMTKAPSSPRTTRAASVRPLSRSLRKC